MGLFAEWVMMKAVTVPPGAVEARFAQEGLQLLGEEDGWTVARARGHDLDELARRLSGPSPEPLIAGWVYDSDVAYLMGVGPGPHRFSLVIGSPEVTWAGEEMDPALVHLATDEGRRQSADAVARWSETNARAVSAADVLAILNRDWTFAEEGVAALAEAVELPDPLSISEAPAPGEQTGVAISLSTNWLANLSAHRLLSRLDRFSRPISISSSHGKTIELHLYEAAVTGAEFDELMLEVQRFVDEIGLPQLTVFASGRAHTVQRQGRINLDD
jgi:hypothetical protein